LNSAFAVSQSSLTVFEAHAAESAFAKFSGMHFVDPG
jgi:hypothetical protein